MKILVINSGSSLLRFQVINSETEKVLAKGPCERIGIDGRFTYRADTGVSLKEQTAMENHAQAMHIILDTLTDPEQGVISRLRKIDAVGHHLTHGGGKFTGFVVITQEVIQTMTGCSDLVPLHDPTDLVGVEACRALMPGTPMVGVFDMASNQTTEPKVSLYGLPYRYHEKHKICRCGLRGTSHQYVSHKAAQFMGQDPGRVKTIVCHLGSGASICAIKRGQVMNNSMGFTPLEGLVMGTRCGDVDPGVLELLSKKKGLDFQRIIAILSQEFGVLGISKNFFSNFRELKDAEIKCHEEATLAREISACKVAKYVGSYTVTMNGVGNAVFTAGIGENDSDIHEEICSYLEYLGIAIDELKNREEGEAMRIFDASPEVNVFVIKTNEELKVAGEAATVAKRLKKRPERVGEGS